MFRYLWLTVALIIAMSGLTIDASIEKAILLKAHGLNDDAKRELIDLIFDENVKGKDKPSAYYLLGEIAFDENRIQTATKTWGYIVEKYPDSDEALMVKKRMDELSKVTLAVHTESFEIDDYSVAKLYLKNADFWSEGKNNRWMIDSSWIPKIEFALKWYDKVISEFPRSEATRVAYIGKIRTLLGWKEADGVVHGVRTDSFDYLKKLVDTFRSFEQDFPDDTTLQACRFQIGQAYFGIGVRSGEKQWLKQAKEWFDEIIVNSGEDETFYRQISEERNKSIISKKFENEVIFK